CVLPVPSAKASTTRATSCPSASGLNTSSTSQVPPGPNGDVEQVSSATPKLSLASSCTATVSDAASLRGLVTVTANVSLALPFCTCPNAWFDGLTMGGRGASGVVVGTGSGLGRMTPACNRNPPTPRRIATTPPMMPITTFVLVKNEPFLE